MMALSATSTAKEVISCFGEGEYLKGRMAIVTGGNSGIGLETCKALASAGCKVILCSRSSAAAYNALNAQSGQVLYNYDPKLIVVKDLDLASLKSVKQFADDIASTEASIDFLVLNAGIMALPNIERTDAGFEKQIGVNHFGHFYLTMLLIGKMAPTSRVIVLASSAHSFGDGVDPGDLNYSKGRRYAAWPAYGQSKAANILFAKGLATRLKRKKLKIAVVSLHPGEIQTNLWRASLFNRLVGTLITKKTVAQGAATTLYACVCPRVLTPGMQGAYLVDCGPSSPSTSACQDLNGNFSDALWKATEADLAVALKKLNLPDLPSFQ